MFEGDVKHVTIPIRNSGSDVLIISDVKSSCECTTLNQPLHDLPPGETTRLEVEFNASGVEGSVSKQIVIHSNDADSRSTVVTLNATVKTELQPVDRSYNIWLGNLTVGKTEKRQVSYRNMTAAPVSIMGANSNSTDISVLGGPETLKPDQVGSVSMSVTPSKEGYAQGRFDIALSGGNQRSLTFTVTYIGIIAR
jgi:hypothetical protein